MKTGKLSAIWAKTGGKQGIKAIKNWMQGQQFINPSSLFQITKMCQWWWARWMLMLLQAHWSCTSESCLNLSLQMNCTPTLQRALVGSSKNNSWWPGSVLKMLFFRRLLLKQYRTVFIMLHRSLEQAIREVEWISEISFGMTSSCCKSEDEQMPWFFESRKCPSFWRAGKE